jgi:N-methylhydantoinase B
VETVIELLADALLTVRGDRMGALPPPGARGGEAGRPGSFAIERTDGSVERLPARATGVPLRRGDRFVMRTSGGGGLGPPTERDPDAVRDDLAAGRVSATGALDDYGHHA